jgi:hypothetical protein
MHYPKTSWRFAILVFALVPPPAVVYLLVELVHLEGENRPSRDELDKEIKSHKISLNLSINAT